MPQLAVMPSTTANSINAPYAYRVCLIVCASILRLTSNRSDAPIFPKDQRMRLQIVDLPRRFALQIGLHGGNARVFGLLKNGLRRPRLDVFEFDEISRWMYFSSNRS